MTTPRAALAQARRLVVKVGSALVTNDGAGLDTQRLSEWSGQIANLVAQGKEVCVVSSGAIACGMR
ncbi:glutamate 5-kinase, partial [Escherichia coli]|nr:glutamate 5-kinase [Escherichia coli]